MLQWLQDEYLARAIAIRADLQGFRSSLTKLITHISRDSEVEMKAKIEKEDISDARDEDTCLYVLACVHRCLI